MEDLQRAATNPTRNQSGSVQSLLKSPVSVVPQTGNPMRRKTIMPVARAIGKLLMVESYLSV